MSLKRTPGTSHVTLSAHSPEPSGNGTSGWVHTPAGPQLVPRLGEENGDAGRRSGLLASCGRVADLVLLLDAMPYATLLLDGRGEVLHESCAAASLLQGGAESDGAHEKILRIAREYMAFPASTQASDGHALAIASRDLRISIAGASYQMWIGHWRGVAAEPLLVLCLEPPHAPGASLGSWRTRFQLTEREAQVAELLALGQRNAEIALRLQIAPHTARRHTERVLSKLGVPSRAAVGAVLREG